MNKSIPEAVVETVARAIYVADAAAIIRDLMRERRGFAQEADRG